MFFYILMVMSEEKDQKSPFKLDQDELFKIGHTDLSYFRDRTHRARILVSLYCTTGTALVTINLQTHRFVANSEMLLLPSSFIQLVEATEGTEFRYMAFSQQLFVEASRMFDPSFFKLINNSVPYFHKDMESRKWFESFFFLVHDLYLSKEHEFRDKIMLNYLSNYCMELYVHVKPFFPEKENNMTLSKDSILRNFIRLIQVNGRTHRDLDFYAKNLCISKRYLSMLTSQITGETPKFFIDRFVILEIRLLLETTQKSMKEIAEELHFPDQSYLGRYFKDHMGVSLTEYRKGYTTD
ncbi:MAG: helix-turn-helix domain-containing protein [Marinifilaceae bacterium]